MKLIDSFSLNPAQAGVVEHGLLTSGFSCILQMPTGSGKTWLASQAIGDVLKAGARAIYVTPLKALAEELCSRWTADYGEDVVGVFTGDYGKEGSPFPVPFEQARLLVMTPERLDACTRNWRTHWAWLPEVELVVVDEIHLLGDPGRGARLEGAISRFRRLNPFCRFLGLSATLGNRGQLADWLDGIEFESSWRPIPLRWSVRRYRRADEKPPLLAEEVGETRGRGGQSLIFVQSRRRAESLSGYLRAQGLHASHHHAGLLHAERRGAEDAFRRSELDVLVATGTLEMGLNLPARKVVLYDLQSFDGSDFVPLSTNSVWQRAGRAGRPGLDADAEAVLLAPAWDRDADRYLDGKFEAIRSGLSRPSALAEQILVEIQCGLARSIPQLHRVFHRSLARRQGLSLPIDRTVGEMVASGMLRSDSKAEEEEGEERFATTKLGRIACRHLLRPETILRLKNFFTSAEHFTDFDLLVALAATADCEPIISVDYEELEDFSEQLAQRRSWLFSAGCPQASTLLQVEGKRFLSCFKIAEVALRWTELGDLGKTAAETHTYTFEVQRLRDSLDRLLLAAAAVRKALHEEAGIGLVEEDKPAPCVTGPIEILRSMIVNGLRREPASLTLVGGIGSKWARKLVAAGISSLRVLANSSRRKLQGLKGLSEERAAKWIKDARGLHDLPKTLTPEAPTLPILRAQHTLSLDPYRLRRAQDLIVRQTVHNEWRVVGGLEPHAIRRRGGTWLCDCQDSANGFVCKHQLAVRHSLSDPEVTAALAHLQTPEDSEALDLHALWFRSRNVRP